MQDGGNACPTRRGPKLRQYKDGGVQFNSNFGTAPRRMHHNY